MRATALLLCIPLLATACPEGEDNALPTIEITAPDGETPTWAGATTLLRARVGDLEDEPTDLTVTWSSDVSGELGASEADGLGDAEIEAVLQLGEHTITAVVRDSAGASASDTLVLQVRTNTAPTVRILAPEADAAIPADAQQPAVLEVDDAEEGPAGLSLAVTIDGARVDAAPDPDGRVELPLDLAEGEHDLAATVTDSGGLVAEASVSWTVVSPNEPPACSVAVPAVGIQRQGTAVPFFGTATDPDGDELTIEWTSDRDGTLNTDPPDEQGDLFFELDDLSAGLHRFTLTVTDPHGASCTDDGLELTIDAPPSVPGVAITPATPTTTATLVASLDGASIDPEGDPVAQGWTWKKNGTLQPALQEATEVPPSATARGEAWTVEVSFSDPLGPAPTLATATVTIGNATPVAGVPTLGPVPLLTASTATCTAGTNTDADSDSVAITFGWEVNGSDPGPTGATLSGDHFDEGDSVVCIATPDDGQGAGNSVGLPVSSAPLVVANSAPGAAVVDVNPDPAAPDLDLVCSVTTAAVDPDPADTVTYTYAWLVDGGASGVTGDTVAASSTAVGQTWTCQAVPTDGQASGPVATATATICSPSTWYEDFDGDGYGNPSVTWFTCPQPSGYVADAGDCNDAVTAIAPLAGDTYDDGTDSDCDGLDCEADFVSGTYFAVCPASVTWWDGHLACQNAGHDGLASIRDANEQAGIWQLFQDAGLDQNFDAWFGYTDELVEGSWGWLDGSNATYTAWSPGEPNNSNNEDCAHFNWPHGSSGWNDAGCTWASPGFLCQAR